jgi:hypothetical protein
VSNCSIVGAPRSGLLHPTGRVGLAVVGCARGIEAALTAHQIPYLDTLLHEANDSIVLIFHDSPRDNGTRAVLHAWAVREPRVRLILSDMGERGERIQRLTLCRNVLLAEAVARLRPSDGYLAQLDLDCRHGSPDALLDAVRSHREGTGRARRHVDGSWIRSRAAGTTFLDPARSSVSPHVRAASWNATSAFDVITTNNLDAYRDMWALRSATLGMDYDCFWDFRQMAARGNCKRRRIYVSPTAAPFGVEAAFNGLAIYAPRALRMAALGSGSPKPCRYENESIDPDSQKRHVVSEHVPFQLCLHTRGVRIGIHPALTSTCHPWLTRYDAIRSFYLRNGTLVTLPKRRMVADANWMQ